MNILENIKNNKDIRKSLIILKQDFDHYRSHSFLKGKLVSYLSHEDPKVRKNAGELLGNYDDTIPILLEAYHNEKTEYVKEAYLKGISKQDCREYSQELQLIQNQLLDIENVSLKHIQAQLKILNPLLLQYQFLKRKTIKKRHEPVDVILTTLPFYQYVIADMVKNLRHKCVSQGVLVRTTSLYDLLTVRVYNDMLFPIGATLMKQNIQDIKSHFEHCHLISVLEKIYDDTSPFYFRVVDGLIEKNSKLMKQVSQMLFELYPQKLLNTSQNYEIEIVLKEVKKGTVNAYLRIPHFCQSRFQYRQNIIPTSMNPYVAATLVQLALPYMKDNARVLDPFTGIGTLLIEKNIRKPSLFSMGVDTYGDAIKIARKNTEKAQQIIYYVHKDSLRFHNEELFDEIITDMPTYAQMKDENKIKELYDRFFLRIPQFIHSDGYVFLYTSEISLVRKNLRLHQDSFVLEELFEIPRGKMKFYYFIIKRK